ncbi:electron transport complex protein RnfC [Amphritea atlantica]|uniref:Ion-translocating oxidoreductase complex subunit C n=2 Tax=Amphritea atlantica TaxID=355243 RepID=A0A1H9MAE1_9GAMM|nr:electron transport complex protein RnfC [Amphritea atlantica]
MLMKFKVRGGVHADERKEQSTETPIRVLGIPPLLSIPLSQHAGLPAKPIVAEGQLVLKGELIGTTAGDRSASIHAPTSGKVLGIGRIQAPHPSLLSYDAIHIEPDGLDTVYVPENPIDPQQLSAEAIADLVDGAGIVGLGGATYPAALKLKAGSRQNVHTLILNGSECEPYLTCDDMLMRERAAEIISGAQLILKAINAKQVIAGIEDNKPQAIRAMREAAQTHDNVEIRVIPTRYPMGSAKQLIKVITGREVPTGGRSSDIGVLVHNVATSFAVHQAIYQARPLISRVVTLSGQALATPQNVEVLIGTPVQWLLEQCDGLVSTPARMLMGGPMMGQILPNTGVPITKGASAILALTEEEINSAEVSPCIRCGSCVQACPMGLLPLEMARHSRADDYDGANEFGLKDCILCGSCAYVCPSHIPLVHYFQFAKGKHRENQIQTRKGEYTKSLSEARMARQEKEAAAKAAAKAEKAAKAEARKKAKSQVEKV